MTRQSRELHLGWVLATVLLTLTIVGATSAEPPTKSDSKARLASFNSDGADNPRLIVLMVIDMFGGDFPERFGKHWGDGGFKRLIEDGAYFPDAHFSFGATKTGPGHATIATGAYPAVHGIVANQWYEVNSPSTNPIGCVEDKKIFVTGTSNVEGMTASSTKNLLVPTFGDQLKKRYGKSAKVWSVGIKDRGTILLAGKEADGAVWWSNQAGDFISSTQFGKKSPSWCEELNRTNYSDRFVSSVWDRALPEEAYKDCAPDDSPFETTKNIVWTKTLPKRMAFGMSRPNEIYYGRLRCSPFGNDLVFEAARQAVMNESLGTDDVPDYLALAISSPDYVGHIFGPDSHEMLDIMVRLDRQIERWLKFLDDRVGLENCLIVTTGDHGVGSAPEVLKTKGIEGGRINVVDFYHKMNNAVRADLGTPDDGVYYMATVDLPWVYVNERNVKQKGAKLSDAVKIAAHVAKSYPGVKDVVITSELNGKSEKEMSPLELAVKRCHYPGRSGHLFVEMEPTWGKVGICAGHGSFREADTHVPLILNGKWFNKGRYNQRVDPIDIAPTLSKILRVEKIKQSAGKSLDMAIAH